MLPIEPITLRTSDKKLATVSIRSRICHAQQTRLSMFIYEIFVWKWWWIVYRRFACAIVIQEVAALNHEVFDDTMKRRIFITDRTWSCWSRMLSRAKLSKILHSSWTLDGIDGVWCDVMWCDVMWCEIFKLCRRNSLSQRKSIATKEACLGFSHLKNCYWDRTCIKNHLGSYIFYEQFHLDASKRGALIWLSHFNVEEAYNISPIYSFHHCWVWTCYFVHCHYFL